MKNSLGDKIKKRRKEMKLSLDKLANISDISKSYLWELENRTTRKPSAEKLTKIAEALEVTINYLLNDSSSSPSEIILKDAFFKKFKKLSKKDRRKIEQLIDLWVEDNK